MSNALECAPLMATILLAEDDQSMRLFLYRALKRAGHAVTAVGEGHMALRHLRARSYDMLLTDVVMPGLDGVDLARQAAALQPQLRIMFITGFAAVALNPANDVPAGASVVSKPFHLKDLVERIESMLASA